jgi:hypothetical protein
VTIRERKEFGVEATHSSPQKHRLEDNTDNVSKEVLETEANLEVGCDGSALSVISRPLS